MADPSLLAAILSGQDPLAAQMAPGYQAAQLSQSALNPEFAHNEGLFGALAKTLAGFAGGAGLQPSVQNVVNQRVANQPNLAQLMAAPDPFQELAANPGKYSAISGGTLLAGATPEAVADARLKAAQGQFFGAKANYAATGGNAPINPAYVPPSQAGGGGRAPGASVPASAPPGSAPILLEAAAKMSPQQRQAIMQNPQLRAKYLAALRAAQPGAQ